MQMSRKRRVLSAVGVVSAAAVVATACSSNGSGTNSTGHTSGVSSGSAAAGTPIKVGMICSCSGPNAATAAAAEQVARAWAQSVNSAGGVNGHSVDLIYRDDARDPGKAVTYAKDLISKGVAVILDESSTATAWAKDVDDAGIPVVGGDLSSDLFYKDPNFYPSGQTIDSVVYADVLTAKQAGATKLGELYCVEAAPCQESVQPHVQIGKELGTPFVYKASISGTAPNYTAQCLAAKNAGVEALFIADAAPILANVATDCARQGYNPIYIEEGTGYIGQIAKTPALNNRLYADFPILPFFAKKPPVQTMNAALDKFYPGLRTSENTFSTIAVSAWTGGLLIEQAVKASRASASDTVSADVLRRGLNSLKNETLDGWSPPLTFTAGQAHHVSCWYTAQIKDGVAVLAHDGKPSCQTAGS